MLYWWHMYCYSSYYTLLVAHVVLLWLLYSNGGTCTVTLVTMLYWWHMYCYSSYYTLLVAHVVLL
jgi:hypothetical protein